MTDHDGSTAPPPESQRGQPKSGRAKRTRTASKWSKRDPTSDRDIDLRKIGSFGGVRYEA